MERCSSAGLATSRCLADASARVIGGGAIDSALSLWSPRTPDPENLAPLDEVDAEEQFSTSKATNSP